VNRQRPHIQGCEYREALSVCLGNYGIEVRKLRLDAVIHGIMVGKTGAAAVVTN
jgi:hypothetical protein